MVVGILEEKFTADQSIESGMSNWSGMEDILATGDCKGPSYMADSTASPLATVVRSQCFIHISSFFVPSLAPSSHCLRAEAPYSRH